MKKIVIISIILALLSPVAYFGYKEHQKQVEIEEFNQKVEMFQNKLNKINESSAENLIPVFMKHVKNDEIYKKFDDDMINSQIATFYRVDGEEKIQLCVDMIIYKIKKFDNNGDVKEQIINYINNLKSGNLDKIDELIVKSFNEAVEDFQGQYEYESKIKNQYLY
jgi:hypothetical protein